MAVVLAFSVATLLALVALFWSARGAITICVLEVADGKVAITKGSLAPRVLSDVEDIVRRPKVRNATLRVSRAKDFAKLEVSGKLSKIQRQQLQNLVGNVPVAKLAGTRRPA